MNKEIEKIVLTGLFIAIGVVLAPLFHSAGLGQVFSPMHFPVLVCGLLLGWKYGLITGLLTPLITSFMLQAPPLFPMATVMSLELAVYGLLSGLIYNKCSLFTSKIANVYVALIVAMKNKTNTLHVRIVAPIEFRVEQVMKEEGVNKDEALKIIDEKDKATSEYLQRFYNINWDDPTNYNIIINTEKIDVDTASRVIVTACSLGHRYRPKSELQKKTKNKI